MARTGTSLPFKVRGGLTPGRAAARSPTPPPTRRPGYASDRQIEKFTAGRLCRNSRFGCKRTSGPNAAAGARQEIDNTPPRRNWLRGPVTSSSVRKNRRFASRRRGRRYRRHAIGRRRRCCRPAPREGLQQRSGNRAGRAPGADCGRARLRSHPAALPARQSASILAATEPSPAGSLSS